MADRQQTTADEIRAALAVEAARIRTARDLSESGRASHLARTYVQSRDDMTKLKRDDAQKLDRCRAELQRLLFGNPRSADASSVISYRDAQDRADKLKTPEEAAALLERAIMSGDEFLGRAIAGRAMGRLALKNMGDGWAQVANRWLQEQDPYTAELAQELADIEHDTTNVKARFAQGMSYTLPTPGELRGKNIDRLASEADGVLG